jgi:acyl CoA:acetate/3-ketoacid CoA transferase alpha subunit
MPADHDAEFTADSDAWPADLPRTLPFPRGRRPVHEAIREQAAERPDAPAVTFYGRTLMWAALDGAIDAFAGGLGARGHAPGDVCALHLQNSPQFLIAYHGAHRAGLTVTPANPQVRATALERQLSDSDAAVVVAHTDLLETARSAAQAAGTDDVVAAEYRAFAAPADADIPADATLVVSGFGSVGYPKAVPGALAESDRDLGVTVVSGGSGGDEIDVEMMAAGQIARRYPYQATDEARNRINGGEVAFHDRNIARLGDEVAFGGLVDADVALVEAVAVGEGWLVPAMSVGPTPEYVAAADRLVVEVNEFPPLGVQQLHDVYQRDRPPHRDPIPLSAPDEHIADQFLRFDPDKLEAVVRTDQPDTAYTFHEPTDRDRTIAANLAGFLATEMDRNPTLADAVNLQFGVGSLGNALMGELSNIDFGGREVTYYGELVQDGLVDMLDAGELATASATALAVRQRTSGNCTTTSSGTPRTSSSGRATCRTTRTSSTASASRSTPPSKWTSTATSTPPTSTAHTSPTASAGAATSTATASWPSRCSVRPRAVGTFPASSRWSPTLTTRNTTWRCSSQSRASPTCAVSRPESGPARSSTLPTPSTGRRSGRISNARRKTAATSPTTSKRSSTGRTARREAAGG